SMIQTMRSRLVTCLLSAFGSSIMVSLASAQAPAALSALEVFPPDITLHTARGRQTFVVKATQADGITRDVTTQATIRLANPALAKLEKNVLTPLVDGMTDLVVEHGGRAQTVPVKVTSAKDDRPISFKLDVMPVFMKAGCNAGSCHGAARGKHG